MRPNVRMPQTGWFLAPELGVKGGNGRLELVGRHMFGRTGTRHQTARVHFVVLAIEASFSRSGRKMCRVPSGPATARWSLPSLFI